MEGLSRRPPTVELTIPILIETPLAPPPLSTVQRTKGPDPVLAAPLKKDGLKEKKAVVGGAGTPALKKAVPGTPAAGVKKAGAAGPVVPPKTRVPLRASS